jgi:hypothetical protein
MSKTSKMNKVVRVATAFLLKRRVQRTIDKSSLLLARKEEADWPSSNAI